MVFFLRKKIIPFRRQEHSEDEKTGTGQRRQMRTRSRVAYRAGVACKIKGIM
jgi:hypothetical protein